MEGFNLAETYRTPIILLFDEVVGHTRERLLVPEPREIPVVFNIVVLGALIAIRPVVKMDSIVNVLQTRLPK